jgi:hypothetical protein
LQQVVQVDRGRQRTRGKGRLSQRQR